MQRRSARIPKSRPAAAASQALAEAILAGIQIMALDEARDGLVFATGSSVDDGVWGALVKRGDREVVRLDPLAFFIPESVADPSIRPAGEELWVEVTIPRKGTPRPIRLGVKKNGTLTPLALR